MPTVDDNQGILRGLLTMWLVALWSVAILLPVFEYPSVNEQILFGLTALVFLIVGRMWSLEISQLVANVAPGIAADRDHSRERDREDQEH